MIALTEIWKISRVSNFRIGEDRRTYLKNKEKTGL